MKTSVSKSELAIGIKGFGPIVPSLAIASGIPVKAIAARAFATAASN